MFGLAPELAEISELEEAAAESAVETGRDEVRLEVGVHDEREFNEMAAPIGSHEVAHLPWTLLRSRIVTICPDHIALQHLLTMYGFQAIALVLRKAAPPAVI